LICLLQSLHVLAQLTEMSAEAVLREWEGRLHPAVEEEEEAAAAGLGQPALAGDL